MKLSTVNAANAVVAFVFGIGFILAPAQLLSLYGITTDAAGILLARLLGASYIGYSLLAWLARNFVAGQERQAIITGFFGGFAASLVVAFVVQLSGLVNALGWFSVALYALFTAAYGYFRFMKPSAR
jgi:fluoride ion exporter CrcB/FEX